MRILVYGAGVLGGNLASNLYRQGTYAIEKKGIASSGIRDMKQVGRGEYISKLRICRYKFNGHIWR